jgi:stage III sporulation protein AB
MVLKLLGAVGVVASSYAIGWYMSLGEEYRANDLADMKNILSRFLSEISFGNSILTEAIDNILDETNCSDIFLNFKNEINNKGTSCIYEMWEKSIKATAQRLYFNSNDYKELLALGKIFSYSDTAIREKVINSTINYLTNEEEKSRNEKQAGKKIYKSLGAAVGILVVILLF